MNAAYDLRRRAPRDGQLPDAVGANGNGHRARPLAQPRSPDLLHAPIGGCFPRIFRSPLRASATSSPGSHSSDSSSSKAEEARPSRRSEQSDKSETSKGRPNRSCGTDSTVASDHPGQQTGANVRNRLSLNHAEALGGKPRMNRAIPRPSSSIVGITEPAYHAGGRGFESRRSGKNPCKFA
jgi:hypothetical protein